ncbi:hypothetical protein H9Q70_008586 [Fusarium xylarioides]|nr:hypothetical protein H9Q70_008586 [Fusarium xylarioides]KAG5778497.1 hypothetical protein H9Q73_007821 [Fusarium xylarioides]
MGCCSSKSPKPEPQSAITLQEHDASGLPGVELGFPQPYQDPKSVDNNNTFPLEGRDIASIPDEELLSAFMTAPRLHHYGAVTISRVSKKLVIKGGPGAPRSEAENMKFASEKLQLPVPKVYRTFTSEIPEYPGMSTTRFIEGHFIVMDYVQGGAIDKNWESYDAITKAAIADQVSDAIEKMQSTTLNDMPVGPIGRSQDAKFHGPWFTDYGAGPFDTLGELEDWCNHKIDVCVMVKQLPPDTTRFKFQDIVLTHQDLALRNLVLDEDMKVWVIDWGCAGVYPKGFEQAALQVQAENEEYASMVLERISDRQDVVIQQLANIAYGLSTGRAL